MKEVGETLLVGSSKGLICYRHQGGSWVQDGVHFLGFPVSACMVDPRNGDWWAALAHRHWGQKMHRSEDRGKSWQELSTPVYPATARLANGQAATLRKVWVLADAGPEDPQGIYAGTEPGGLFYSPDAGRSWQLVEALWNHPSRQQAWFGAGRDHPFIHSIVLDPRDSRHVYIAVSCAGVFETRDGGQSWEARNQGLRATYLPNPTPEVGHDPHMLHLCREHPDVLWQQNHCGVYRSVNGGGQWVEVSGADGFPYYGFALAVDEQDPERAWVIPAISDEIRVAVDQALCVCATEDGGKTWHARRKGLPQTGVFDIVYRHGFDKTGPRLAFGSATGNLYLSEDFGASWTHLSSHLPQINYLRFA